MILRLALEIKRRSCAKAHMSFIELELIEELFIPAEKQEIIAQLKGGMAGLRDERLHRSGEQTNDLAETETQ